MQGHGTYYLSFHNGPPNQKQCYWPEYSCQYQLFSLTEDIIKAMENKKQVDLVLLVFCKVPHKRLLCKLKNNGIRCDLIIWIEQWLTKHSQRVIVDNHTSSEVPVKSGIPQGTVLGPLLFLLHINDIDTNILSTISLFAVDCIVCRTIDSECDSQGLQKDLDTILHWAETWQILLNKEKCVITWCTRSPSPIRTDYKLKDNIIKNISQHWYLGIILDMHWSHHITTMCKKANKSLNFIHQNLSKCHQD